MQVRLNGYMASTGSAQSPECGFFSFFLTALTDAPPKTWKLLEGLPDFSAVARTLSGHQPGLAGAAAPSAVP